MSRIKDHYFEQFERQQLECGGFDSSNGISSAQIEQDQRAAGYTALPQATHADELTELEF